RDGRHYDRRRDDPPPHIVRQWYHEIEQDRERQGRYPRPRRPERRGHTDRAEERRARPPYRGEHVHAPPPAVRSTPRRATHRCSRSAARAKTSAAAKSHGARVERTDSGAGSSSAATYRSADPSPVSSVCRALSAGATAPAPSQGPASRAASRRNRGCSTRSPAAGTPTATLLMHPSPCGVSTAAGAPSTQRATTRCAPPPAGEFAEATSYSTR